MIAVGVYVYLYVPEGAAEAVGPRRLGARPGKKKVGAASWRLGAGSFG
jgi:hypothetical protein